MSTEARTPKRKEDQRPSSPSLESFDRSGQRNLDPAVTSQDAALSRTHDRNAPWSIILAGGEGERLRPLTERWLGHHKPKQYCTFVGSRSMFQHTHDRADQISLPERKLTVIARNHERDVHSQLVKAKAGRVISQPKNCGTAVGIFLALTHIRAEEPDATVIIFPSDHFVYPEDRFVELVRTAAQAARQMEHRLLLLGALPDRPEPEYGWIEPGRDLAWIHGYRVLAAKGFREKPGPERCLQAMADGALWNTLILAGKLKTLWMMGWICFPEVMKLFEAYGESIATSEELSVLEAIFEIMPARNFSTHLLERVPSRLAVVEMKGVLWCDWGRPDRILETLSHVGKRPAFSLIHATG